jgi:hypothetical protein
MLEEHPPPTMAVLQNPVAGKYSGQIPATTVSLRFLHFKHQTHSKSNPQHNPINTNTIRSTELGIRSKPNKIRWPSTKIRRARKPSPNSTFYIPNRSLQVQQSIPGIKNIKQSTTNPENSKLTNTPKKLDFYIYITIIQTKNINMILRSFASYRY